MKLLGLITLLVVAAGGAALMTFAGPNETGQDPAVTLQRAIQLETVEGDLNAAIEHYKQVIKSSGGNRSVAAKALLRLGGCFEKLGDTEARAAYERVVREFADQAETVAQARARLAALGGVSNRAARTGLAVRRLLPGSAVDVTGAPSPDGRYLSISDPDSGDLAVLEIGTGQKRRLTNKGSWSTAEAAVMSRWSPDGKKIAYVWLNKDMSPDSGSSGVMDPVHEPCRRQERFWTGLRMANILLLASPEKIAATISP